MRSPLPPPEDEGDRRLLNRVQAHGWHIIHVGRSVEDDSEGPDWSYSIGLFHTFGHPELIVVGLPWSTAEAVINDIGSRVRAGQRFDHGMIDSDVLENRDVRFVTMRTDAYRAHLGYAIWFYRGVEFPVLQVVWPDGVGRFPWDPAYALDDSIQPILGRIEKAP
ncbi:DUF4262 domain-containing protein [Polyangium mundeleinium]|uniref:DUF4262 domain-containing protein n=1 Tax=Polyangium mundeleinium TaxID=2995306 RepID=A0ABT5F2B0_9BACT|nr:DUF4262 domain-containing protein [Polyangium mundeleinium]MDC0747622.1 DUF4262 domain-containing protein [Polyangium mundeleinium]